MCSGAARRRGRPMRRATSGATNQSPSSGAAARIALGLTHATSAAIAVATIGDHASVLQYDARASPTSVCAAVVHSRRCLRVIPVRTSTRTIASTTTADSCARNAIASSHRPVCAARRRRSRTMPGTTGATRSASTPTVHHTGEPGSHVQPDTSKTRAAGLVRLRRRLSKIFQRSILDSAFCVERSRVGTCGNNHRTSCQSPRTHRCRRLEYDA